MIFGMWNPEKILHQCVIDFPSHLYAVATLSLPSYIHKVIFQQYMNFSLFTLSQNKTNCRPSHDCELARHTRKMSPHSTTLWNAELICLMDGILFPSKRWWLRKRELCCMVLVAMERADCVMWQLECQASNVIASICCTWAWRYLGLAHWGLRRLCVWIWPYPFSGSWDISHTYKKTTDWQRQKQNLPQFTACGN